MTKSIVVATATREDEPDTLYLSNLYWVEFSEYKHDATVFQTKVVALKFIEEIKQDCPRLDYTYHLEDIGNENADNA